MFQRDYFMRMIAQMTEAIGQVLRLRQEQKHEEALIVIDELLEKHFRLNGKLVRSLSEEDLIRLMSKNGIPDTDQLQAVALLIKQEAILRDEMGMEAESFALNVRSLRLFIRLSLMEAEPSIVRPEEQIEELLEALAPYELPDSAKRLLMEWHESQGRYDKTEDVMHELLESGALTAAEAAAAYERLLGMSDERLEAGGLPRTEIEEALSALEAINKE
jgi:hypothetical protein